MIVSTEQQSEDEISIQAVLFACSMNAVRSPMAEALLKWRTGGKLFVQSCGAREDGDMDGFAVYVMSELGLDISDHHPRSFEELEDGGFDLVITLAADAHSKAIDLTRSEAVDVEFWETPDVTVVHGSRDQKLEAYREVRDQLDENIRRRFAQWVTQ